MHRRLRCWCLFVRQTPRKALFWTICGVKIQFLRPKMPKNAIFPKNFMIFECSKYVKKWSSRGLSSYTEKFSSKTEFFGILRSKMDFRLRDFTGNIENFQHIFDPKAFLSHDRIKKVSWIFLSAWSDFEKILDSWKTNLFDNFYKNPPNPPAGSLRIWRVPARKPAPP